jgi:hypothetical protein
VGINAESSTAYTTGAAAFITLVTGLWSSGSAGHYVARSYTAAGGSLNTGTVSDVGGFQGVAPGTGSNIQFPNGPDGGMWLAPLRIAEIATSAARGHYRGLWCPMHAVASFADGDTFSGTGAFAGKTFTIVKLVYPSAGIIAVETSDTVDTN